MKPSIFVLCIMEGLPMSLKVRIQRKSRVASRLSAVEVFLLLGEHSGISIISVGKLSSSASK